MSEYPYKGVIGILTRAGQTFAIKDGTLGVVKSKKEGGQLLVMSLVGSKPESKLLISEGEIVGFYFKDKGTDVGSTGEEVKGDNKGRDSKGSGKTDA